MKIEHIAIYVKDLERSATFFETYFGAIRNTLYQNSNTGFSSYFLRFADGARLELMNDPLTVGTMPRVQIGYAHIAFSVGSPGAVIALTEKLRADGYRIASEPRTTGDGYFESCIYDREGNKIEITV